MKSSRTTPLLIPCAAWADRLAALHPGDLSPDEQTALRQHLSGGPACAAVYAAYQRIDACILSLPAVQLSTQQIAQVEARIDDQSARDHHRSLTTVPQDHRMPQARMPAR